MIHFVTPGKHSRHRPHPDLASRGQSSTPQDPSGAQLNRGIDMSTHRDYLFDLGYEIKLYAIEARRERDAAPEGSEERAFNSGQLLAFHRVVSLMQQQAEGFGIPLSDLRLDDILPDRDLT